MREHKENNIYNLRKSQQEELSKGVSREKGLMEKSNEENSLMKRMVSDLFKGGLK